MTLDDLLSRFPESQQTGDSWMVRCPAHNDHRPSLSVRTGDSGKLLFNCFAGCTEDAIREALQLEPSDLHPTRESHDAPPKTGRLVATYPYRNAKGALLFDVLRYADPKTFRQRRADGRWSVKGVALVLYRLPELLAADPALPVFVVAGEKDVDNLRATGRVATTNPGGENTKQFLTGRSLEPLRNRHVVIIPDNDNTGQKHADRVAVALNGIAASIKMLYLPGLPEKGDVSDWLEQGPHFKDLEALAADLPVWASGLASSPLTESGDAQYFAHRQAARVRFDYLQGRWLIFDGHTWQPDPDGALRRLALDTIRARQRDATELTNTEERKRLFKWAIDGESRHRQENMLTLAKKEKPIADDGRTWNAEPYLLGAPNGVIDLKTGTLRAGTPEDRITMIVRVPFDFAALCPVWTATVEQIFGGDPDLIAYVQRAFGYSLTGDCREECLFFCWGDGRNGKGTLMNTFAYVLGDYADDLPFSAIELHDRASIPNDIAKLVGKRYATASESGETTRLNEARVKALTGRDPITARFMRAEYFTFQPVAKFWLAANRKPIVRDDSQGFWSRIHLIPFTQSFAGKENKQLKDQLRAEAPGILAWAVRGCLDWQRDGLNPPAVVRDATAEYRRESEPLTPFFEACCVIRDGSKVQASDLYRAYLRWSDSYFVKGRLTLTAFGKELRKRFTADEKRTITYIGIGLREEREPEQEGFEM